VVLTLSAVTVLVPSYDAGLAFFVTGLGFALIEDSDLGAGKRWVLVAPSATSQTRILLAQPGNDAQALAIGNQTGGRVFLFLHTDDFDRDAARVQAAGGVFQEPPRDEVYGRVAVFKDPFANLWDLIQPVG
jgi:catechol 2,3-dioxygenase-like lactoylglutathione lyase family enzyme